MRHLIPALLAALVAASGAARAEYTIKPVEVTVEDRERAMRERPMLFGMGIIWNGRSTVYRFPDDFNRIMAERIEAAGVTATRYGFDWAQIERTPTEYDWSRVEESNHLERFFEMDIEVIGLINTVPGWASPEFKPGTYGPVEDPEVAELFEAFCKALAERYRGRIRYYQFGHGMDIDFGWLPEADPESYARWLQRAYKGLKAGDPDCILATGTHLGRSPAFLQKLYQAGAQPYFDAVAVSGSPAPPDAAQGDEAFDWKKIEAYRAVMVRHDDEATPIWCTEYAWPFEVIGPEKQGDYLARSLDYLVHYPFITVGVYMTMADWHRGTAGLFGLCDKDLNPRPGYTVWEKTVAPVFQKVRGKPGDRATRSADEGS